MSYYSLAKYSDFWLIFTEIELAGNTIPMYLAPGASWQWTTDQEGARRFQYSWAALAHAYDHCPFKLYRSDLPDGSGYIELDFVYNRCIIHRNTGAAVMATATLTFDAMFALRSLAIPGPAKAAATPAPKDYMDAT